MKSAEVTYKGIRIENVRSNGNKITGRNILAYATDHHKDSWMYSDSLAKAKKLIDLIVVCNPEISNGRLVLTADQICDLTTIGWYGEGSYTTTVAKVLAVKS